MARNSFGRNSGGDKTILLFVGVFFLMIMALIAVVFVYFLSNNDGTGILGIGGKEEVQDGSLNKKTVAVLVPINDIPPSIPLADSLFTIIQKPELEVDQRAIRNYEEIRNKFSRVVLVRGRFFTKDDISSVRPSSNVATAIPDGYRAVTIKVNATSSVEGWARAGSKVDVHWTTSGRGGNNTIKTIVEGAKVLSAERQTQTGQQIDANAKVPSTITLLVTAEDAQKILLAETSDGVLSLSLRGDNDSGKATGGRSAISKQDLMGGGRKIIVNKQPEQVGIVTIDGQRYSIGKNGKFTPIVDE